MMQDDYRAAISNAIDELHERLRAAALHTPGGVLFDPERSAIIHSVARHHGVSVERLLQEGRT